MVSSVQGEASTGWSSHQALPKAAISSILCLELPWWGQPELSHCPSPGVSEGGTRTAQGKCCNQALDGSRLPSVMSGREGGREGSTLCLDQRHASFYMGVCKMRLHKPSPAPSLKATPTFFSWMTHW